MSSMSSAANAWERVLRSADRYLAVRSKAKQLTTIYRNNSSKLKLQIILARTITQCSSRSSHFLVIEEVAPSNYRKSV